VRQQRGANGAFQNNTAYRLNIIIQPTVAIDGFEVDDIPSLATLAQLGETQQRSFHTTNDIDWVKVTLDEPSRIIARTEGNPVLDTRIEIFPAGIRLKSHSMQRFALPGQSFTKHAAVASEILPSGDYNVRISQSATAPIVSEYLFFIDLEEAPGTVFPDTYEDDDSIGTAKSAKKSVVQTRSMVSADDLEFIKLIVREKQALTVYTTGSLLFDTEMRLYDTSGVEQLQVARGNPDNPMTGHAKLVTEPLEPGTYYIEVKQTFFIPDIYLPVPEYQLHIEFEKLSAVEMSPIINLLLLE